MKHDKKQHQIKKKIWKMPFLVNELFKDEDWEKFDSTAMEEPLPAEAMKAKIQYAILHEEEEMERKVLRRYRLVKMLRYSAAAAIIVFFSFYLVTWWTQDSVPQPADQWSAAQSVVAAQDTVWISKENKNPRSIIFDLPDGSHVRLFAQSKIRYVKNFAEHARDIELLGKAYFDVVSDPNRPFSVLANGTKTTALGTSFTINTKLKHQSVTVALHTGKVLVSSLSDHFKHVFLDGPGQKLTVDSRGATRIEAVNKKQPLNMPDLSAPDLLNLKNTPMPAVLQALEIAFKEQIHLGDKGIAAIHYTGEIDVQKNSLKDILTTICLINELRFVANADGSYTLYKQENTTTEHLNN
ncbi:FecR domain-containing protein [Sphingobacterium sp.]|uniref:FecR family protein n=1 Tax=Sphingobacterium sp. TaxID=341027 RepID=UPI00289F7FB1|nr:FecR domain-containing protein [Sphingobacterium sp.]